MCGRFTIYSEESRIRELFHLEHTEPVGLEPRYNVAPSQNIAIIRDTRTSREMVYARWGLIPHWAQTPETKYSTINARIEGIEQKPSYKTPYRHQRCLIPADGYYEWPKAGTIKSPCYIHQRKPFAFAGLWDHWEVKDAALDSCTIITLPASDELINIHPRMPAIVPPCHYDHWLDARITNPDEIKELISRQPAMEFYPVTTWVNKPQNEGAKCIEPVGRNQ